MKAYTIKSSLFNLLLVTLVSSCIEQETGISPATENINIEKSMTTNGTDVYTIAPSGDMSGVVDAINIQNALNTL